MLGYIHFDLPARAVRSKIKVLVKLGNFRLSEIREIDFDFQVPALYWRLSYYDTISR